MERLTYRGVKDMHIGWAMPVDLSNVYLPNRGVGISELCSMVGVIEDMLEKYHVDSLDELDKILNTSSRILELKSVPLDNKDIVELVSELYKYKVKEDKNN